ncbi:MAG TPA: D-2-hydroxyacid dehydrogenase [Gemmataceae bacterium]|jgi:phosphoglycerate dehydrogenase-like enzyme|nr:D-2-hydroxyacid dehydrogenase [Gemmataceae bacterium]
MKIVIYPAVDAHRFDRLRHVTTKCTLVNAADEADARLLVVDADAFLGKITPTILDAAKQLRWVQSFTASLEHYLFPALVEHPCVLTNMRGLFSDVIADQVMGYVICFARNLHTYIRNQLQRRWEPVGGEAARVSFAAGPGEVSAIDRAHQSLSEQTMGIIGLGAIGAEIARRANAFGIRVIAIDPRRTDCPPEVEWVRTPAHLPGLLAESDYVVVAAPHTPSTAHMIGALQLRSMKSSAILINIGRGAIVDLNALTNSLRTGEIAGAALDVFEVEPLPTDHELWTMPNVILTPHVAGYSPRIAERHLCVLIDNLRRFTAGEPLFNVVDKREWY